MILQNYYFRLREDVRVQYENYNWSDGKLHSNWSNSNIIEIKVNNSMFNIKLKVERTHVLPVTSYNTSTSYKLTSDNTRTSYEWQHKNKFPFTTEDKLRVTKKGQVTSDNTKEVLGWQHGYVQTVQHMLESRNQYLQLMIPLPLRAYTNKVLLLNFN